MNILHDVQFEFLVVWCWELLFWVLIKQLEENGPAKWWVQYGHQFWVREIIRVIWSYWLFDLLRFKWWKLGFPEWGVGSIEVWPLQLAKMTELFDVILNFKCSFFSITLPWLLFFWAPLFIEVYWRLLFIEDYWCLCFEQDEGVTLLLFWVQNLSGGLVIDVFILKHGEALTVVRRNGI